MGKVNHYQVILEAGLKAFHTKGYNATGVQEIASLAGVPKGSFYNHFASKEALGTAVVNLYWDQAEAARAILRNKKLPVLKRIERHFAAFGYPQDGCLVGNFTAELSGQDKFREQLRLIWRTWMGLIAECLAEGQQEGSVRSDMSAGELGRFALLQWEGAVLMSRAERSAEVLTQTRKLIVAMLKK